MKIAVLMGGCSGERNVSFTSGRSVYNALKSNGHEVLAIDPALGENCVIDIQNMDIPNEIPSDDELKSLNPANYIDCLNSEIFQSIDKVFNLVHGKWGEDGHLQALMDMKKISYVGSKMRACAVSMDKINTKILFEAVGITTPKWAAVSKKANLDEELFREIRSELGKKVVIKPYDQGSALGMSIIETSSFEEFENAVKLTHNYSEIALIEEYISGRELTVAVIDDTVYPIVEIKPKEGFYDYKNKYTGGSTEYICPADLPSDVADFTMNLADSANSIVGCRHFSRVDFRLSDDFVPYCLEINTVPGFTGLSLLPKATAAGGLNFNDLCEKLIELA
jgi:D-alanine-D-alanine ligase